MHHLSLGYTLDSAWTPRIEGLFDIASGDDDPNDGENNRYDSLFGVPRFEYGPTGLFRPVTRANVVSPGLRLTLKPGSGWTVRLMQRFNYLESNTDSWNSYRDPNGASGAHTGNLTELVLRKDNVEKTRRVEFGVGWHEAGSFAETTNTDPDNDDALYGYAMIQFWF